MIGKDQLNRRFGISEIDPTIVDQEVYTRISQQYRDLAGTLDMLLPDGREKSLALTELESSMFWGLSAYLRGSA